MEENEILIWVLNFIPGLAFIETMNFWEKTYSHLSSIFSSPLFSSIVTLYALILLYFPYQFLIRIVFSPVPIIATVLLLSLLRLGAIQRYKDENHKEKEDGLCQTEPVVDASEGDIGNRAIKENNHTEAEQIPGLPYEDQYWVMYQSETNSESEMGYDPNPYFEDSFVQWNVRAPLEVIYEAYEGEEEDEDQNEKEENRDLGLERYPSLSLYYPESDSDSSSDGDFPATGVWDSPENMCFKWEEEDREGLIEIALDANNNKRVMDSHVEEENLIEIDISQRETMNSPARIVVFRQG
ncbi:hypothetical protein FEM48_Zijuj01G0144300 [Ziziphus jujuba var. spinosa]|uniref:Transmembrane protein n=1 Tax=Ziziphus jujuba var. spinosa TaxID=714518 RepID=A0A978W1S7_ZIZJJ|nr:hypothetical protein FEM48_Zijuj01G0144300 [Ziziphus jujuba var. spinosa]